MRGVSIHRGPPRDVAFRFKRVVLLHDEYDWVADLILRRKVSFGIYPQAANSHRRNVKRAQRRFDVDSDGARVFRTRGLVGRVRIWTPFGRPRVRARRVVVDSDQVIAWFQASKRCSSVAAGVGLDFGRNGVRQNCVGRCLLNGFTGH